MSLKNNKLTTFGFTLIELLAIIIIIGIIAVIAVPTVKNLTEDAKKKAFINTARGIIQAGNLYYSRKDMMDEINGDMVFTFPDNAEELELQGKLPESGEMTINEDGDIELVISNKDYCITKGFTDKDITITEDVETCGTSDGSGDNSGNGGNNNDNQDSNENWETLFEGSLEVAYDDDFKVYVGHISDLRLTDDSDRLLRLTINGNVFHGPTMVTEDEYYGVGNPCLIKSYLSDDTGEDYYLGTHIDGVFIYTASQFGAREPGTYQLKIEKLLKDPVAYTYNGMRLPKLPTVDGYTDSYIITSANETKLIMSTFFFDYSVSENAFYSFIDDTSIIEYIYDSVPGWVRNEEGDAIFAEGEKYSINGQTLIWSHSDVEDNETYELVLEGSEPVPIFDYKEW